MEKVCVKRLKFQNINLNPLSLPLLIIETQKRMNMPWYQATLCRAGITANDLLSLYLVESTHTVAPAPYTTTPIPDTHEWSKREIEVFGASMALILLCQYLTDNPMTTPSALDLRKSEWPTAVTSTTRPTGVKVGNIKLFLDSLGLAPQYEDVIDGLVNGFRIEYKGERTTTINPTSTPADPEAARLLHEYLQREVELGRLIGPLPGIPEFLSFVKTSPVTLIEKKSMGQPVIPTKWRMIYNGSRGKKYGTSVNCGISAEDATVQYVNFDNVLDLVRKAGPGCTLTKTDVEEAFRHLGVHIDDIACQGILLEGRLYLETRLVFGLRTSPKIFSRFAGTLRDIFQRVALCPGMRNMLDDFFHVEEGEFSRANHLILPAFLSFFDAMGVPWAAKKTEAPSTKMIILGFEIDTIAMTFQVPEKRMAALREQLPLFKNKSVVSKNEIARLVEVLSWCCFSVRNGRTFLRRLIDLMKTLKEQHHTTILDDSAKQDIEWWIKLAPVFNGTARIIDPKPLTVLFTRTDSSLPVCAGVWGDKWWFYRFSERDDIMFTHISVKELFAVVCNCKTFHQALPGVTLHVECDNAPTVEAINSGRCKDATMMKLIRELFYLRVEYSFQIVAIHLPGKLNPVADALSRDRLRHRAWEFQPSLERMPTRPSLPTMLW